MSYSDEMPGYGKHTVREGDAAWDIAGWFTDSPLNYRNIVEINGSTLTDWEIRHLEIGSKLYIKLDEITGLELDTTMVSSTSGSTVGSSETQANHIESDFHSYTVKPNDTLSGISLSYFGSTDYWPVIRDSSGAGFDETTARGLQIGENLLLPKSLFSENGQKLSGQTEEISREDFDDTTDDPEKGRDTATTTKETGFDKENSDTEEGSDSDKEDSNTNGVNTSLSSSLPVDSGLKPLQGSQFQIGRTVVTVKDSNLSGTLTVETMPSDNGTSITVSTDLADIVDINEAREELDNIFTVDFEKQVLDWLTVAVENNGEKFSVGAEIAKTSDGQTISMEVGKSVLQDMWDVSLSTKKDVELDDGTKATIDVEYEVKLAASRKDHIPP